MAGEIQHPVMLVGAGPGDPDLLTIKAWRVISKAQVVVYDKLVSNPIMDLVPPGASRIFAGKQARHHHMPQPEINELLVTLARSGRRVVRLKGGDPFVFGRGGEEAVHLAKSGVPFEIVPGVTSSAGAAAYAGIPLTHRDHAHGVRFVTGHMADGKDLTQDLDWAGLADPNTTLVIYMGLTNLARISAKLIEHGLPQDFPAAAINNGTRPDQRVVISTLSELPKAVNRDTFRGPTLVVIGTVVTLADTLDWFQACFAPSVMTDLDIERLPTEPMITARPAE